VPLKRPVTLPQARRWPAAAKRRESFCARMGGMRDKLTGEDAAADPDSPINRALAAWDCDDPELLKREHVSKGIRMKITQSKVGAEARKPARKTAAKNPAATPEILERHKLPNGGAIRLQKRGTKFDVLINSTGIAWRYLSKGVSESHARATLEMRLLGAKNPAPAYMVSWRSSASLRWQSSPATTKAQAIKEARALEAEGARDVSVSVFKDGVSQDVDWRKAESNPARKPAAKPARKPAAKLYAVHKVGMRSPIAVFASRADAVKFGQSWADIHKSPVQVVAS